MAEISIHYTGDLVRNHHVSLKILSITTSCLQGAVNRAYLDNKHGGVWKHARISGLDYEAVAFWVGPAQKGGFVLDAICNTSIGKSIANRLSAALNPVYEKIKSESIEEAVSLNSQVPTVAASLSTNGPLTYEDFIKTTSELSSHTYGDRSILKEIDHLLSVLRSKNSGESQLELTVEGDNPTSYQFGRTNSHNFHKHVAKRALALPVLYYGVIDRLDRKNRSGRFINQFNERSCSIYFQNDQDFLIAHPYLAKGTVGIIASPILEYGSFDMNSGDLFFIKLGPGYGRDI